MKKTNLLVAFFFSFIMSVSAQAKMTTLQQKDFISPDKSKKISLVCQHKDGEVKNYSSYHGIWQVDCKIDLEYLKKKTKTNAGNIVSFSNWYFHKDNLPFNAGYINAQWSSDNRFVAVFYFIPDYTTLIAQRRYENYTTWNDNLAVLDTNSIASELIVFKDNLVDYTDREDLKAYRYAFIDSDGYFDYESKVEFSEDGVIYYYSDQSFTIDQIYTVFKRKGYYRYKTDLQFTDCENKDLGTINATANPAAMVPGD